MTPYRIREVNGRDPEVAADIQELHEATFGSEAPQVSTDEGYWWLAYLGDDPVAFAGMVPSYKCSDAGYLIRSGVSADHRGQGLQVRLLKARERKARKLGWDVILTDTTDNLPSANSLIRAGFRLYQPKYPWAFAHSLYWRKDFS